MTITHQYYQEASRSCDTPTMHQLLLNRDIYTEFLIKYVPHARRFLWVVTADIKDLHVDTDDGFKPFLSLLADLVDNGIAVRLIHAKEPGPRFREDFDLHASLIDNELFERILCPRVHTKAIVVDAAVAFVGSANLTGAGLGAKSDQKRNFEAGFAFDDQQHIQQLMDWIDQLYLGEFCRDCKRRDFCPDPIADAIR